MSEASVKTYEIDGTTYEQRPMVLGQIRQLMSVLQGLKIPADGGSLQVIAALGGRLGEALAVVLTEQGKSLRGKDLAALATELEFTISPDQTIDVVEDFFTCNPIASLLQRLTTAMGGITGGMMGMVTGSKTPASSSLEETSPAEETSSGT